MKIGLRIFLGYFLIVGLAGFFVMRVFVNEVKPGVRQAMEDTLADTANALAEQAAPDLRAGVIANGRFAAAIDGLSGREIDAKIWNYRKRKIDYRVYITDARGIVVYDSAHRDVGRDYSRWNDVYLTLRGRYGARSTLSDKDDPTSSVMHVAAPIRDGERIVGVLTVAKPNKRIQPFIDASRQAILRQGWLLLGLSFLIGIAVTWWLSRSLATLGRYAQAVTSGERVPPPDLGRNEIGDLGRALSTMRERLDGKQYVEQYVQTLAHEMKSPLAAIRAATEILEDQPPEADRERFLANIASQTERLSAMIDKVLALAAVEYRQSLDRLESVDLQALLAEAVEDLSPRLERQQVRVELEAEAGASMRGNAFLLRQAIANLLDNALEFSPAEAVVQVRLWREGERWRLRIADQGPGVPEFALSRVFERFYSLPRPDGARSSGIGLSFVREVVALHGGEVRLGNRQPGQGSGAVAELELPLR